MTSILVAAMVIALVMQAAIRSHERLYASSIFVVMSVLHLVFADAFSDLGGLYPYLIASIFDALIVAAMAKISTVVPTTIYLYRICGAEIVLNLIGWIMWEADLRYYDKIYLSAFYVLNAYTIYILLRKDEADDRGGLRVDSWADLIRAIVSPSSCHVQRGGK